MHPNTISRRQMLKFSAATAAAVSLPTPFPLRAATPTGGTPVDLGTRRELFVDDFLIERLSGAVLKAHQPEPREVVLTCDAPWEGNTSAYYTLFQDGDRFRMYYRGAHFDEATKKESHPEVACYAESSDGIHWSKPELGLFDFNGSKRNNIVWAGGGPVHNFTPFKDGNPDRKPGAHYKALLRTAKGKSGLLALQSPDGVRWSLMTNEPVITAGAFDSQNLAFWDGVRGDYRAYWRIFSNKVRAIRTATSKDFLDWEHQADLQYEDSPSEHLYTNAIQPYFRAPHLFVGFPTRFQPKNQQVEPVFMTSRDGVVFRRWNEPLIPITAPKDRDGNRSNYLTWGLLQLPGREREVSVYATEAYYTGPGSRVRRFSFRTDGFVSVQASSKAGELLTKPLKFSGNQLELNCVTQGAGLVRVEVCDRSGTPSRGFAINDCAPVRGDDLAHIVKWKGGANLGSFAGQPVRLRFELSDADLYSMKFS